MTTSLLKLLMLPLALGKELHLRHLSPECRKLLRKAGKMVEVNVIEDPQYHVATDALD